MLALELGFHTVTWRSPRGNSAHFVLVFSPHLSSHCSRKKKKKKKITYHQNSLYSTRSLLPAALETACPCGDPRPLTFLETVVKKRMLSAWLCMIPSKTGPVRWVWPVFWGNKFPSLSAGNEKSHSARRGRPSRECVQESCFPFISECLQHRGLPVVIVLCPPPHLHPILGYEAVHL